MTAEKSFTLLQLQQSIKRKMQEVGQQGFWITAEIAEVKYTNHCYIELVQKEIAQNNEIVAKARATIWANQLFFIKNSLGENWQQIIKQGAKILTKVFINYHEVYGLNLVITEIDLSYILGELELQKQQTINYLKDNQLIDKQQRLTLPVVIQKIAVLSSAEAAGYEDFINQLQQNTQGYQFSIQLFNVAVQGDKSITAISQTLHKLAQKKQLKYEYDVVVVIRGGGSRLDLEAFNALEMAIEIANFPIPVFTGIGHQKDQGVADLVSFQSFKTPTAVADYILLYNINYENECLNSYKNILNSSQNLLNTNLYRLKTQKSNILQKIQYLAASEKQQLKHKQRYIYQQVKSSLQNETKDLEILQKKFTLSHPAKILAKGYSITLVNGKPISLTTSVETGDVVTTKTQFFSFESRV